MMRKDVLKTPKPDPNKLIFFDPEVGRGDIVHPTEDIIDSVKISVELYAGRLKGTVATKVSCRSMMAEGLQDNAVPLFHSDDRHMEYPTRTNGEESKVAKAWPRTVMLEDPVDSAVLKSGGGSVL
jgi:hypothetical protein